LRQKYKKKNLSQAAGDNVCNENIPSRIGSTVLIKPVKQQKWDIKSNCFNIPFLSQFFLPVTE